MKIVSPHTRRMNPLFRYMYVQVEIGYRRVQSVVSYSVVKATSNGKQFSLLLFAIALLSSSQLHAQPGGTIPKCIISGKVLDATTQKPLPYSTVSVLRMKGDTSRPVTGTIVQQNGTFLIKDVPPGMYRILIRFIGYKAYRIDSVLAIPGTPRDVGTILLTESATKSKEVTVTAERDLIQTGIDKRTYSVGKDLTVAGGTLTDVLQNVPSVSVDEDRNIQLRGNSNVTILVDGKPSLLVGGGRGGSGGGLDQIPVDAIESVEIITNPSAKYDAEGMTGIINIVLRKEQRSGINGSVSLNVGTRDKYTPTFVGNYRTDDINVFVNYSYSLQNFFNLGISRLENRSLTTYINQKNDGNSRSYAHTPRIGADFKLGGGQTLSASFGASIRSNENVSWIDYTFLRGENQIPTSLQERFNKELEDSRSYDANLGYKVELDDKQKLSADVRYSFSDSQTDLNARQDSLPSLASIIRQNTASISRNAILTVQTDYENRIGQSSKVEGGLKAISRNIDNDFSAEKFNTVSNRFENQQELTNRVVFGELVLSAYATYSATEGDFSYSAGLRAENTMYDVDQRTTNQVFNNSYFSLFPSAFVRWKFSQVGELGLSYSRRINRPSVEALNPFPQFNDPFNFRQGNPFVLPEFTNSFELNAQYFGEWFTLNPSVYYRNTSDFIARYRTIDSNDITRTTFANFSGTQSVGAELVAQTTITDWWRINGSANVFRQFIDAQNQRANLTNSGWGMNMRVNSNFVLAEPLTFQLSYSNFLIGAVAQGFIRPFFNWDAAIRYEFLDKKASLSLRIADMFDTRQFSLQTNVPEFFQDFTRKRETRIAFLTFSYRFGFDDPTQQQPRPPEQPRSDEGF